MSPPKLMSNWIRNLLFQAGAAAALLLATAAPVGAQSIIVPVGPEFLVNTYTPSDQQFPFASSDADGDFVVVWRSVGQDGSNVGIYAQRYASSGGPLGGEFRVNTYTTGSQTFPAVSSDAAGDFVVVWDSITGGGSDGIYGQRYASNGGPLGGQFHVDTHTIFGGTAPSVSSDADGDLVVVWYGDDDDPNTDQTQIFGQRYASNGGPLGAEFRVNTYSITANLVLLDASVSSDADGDFVVVWSTGSGNDIYGQRYASNGGPLGGQFRVNTYTTSNQDDGSISSDADGDFVVVWQSAGGQDGSDYGVYGQRYASSGAPLGGEFRVNTYTSSDQEHPSVSRDPQGGFVVFWGSRGQDGGGNGIYGQRYASSGAPLGGEFRVNTYTSSEQERPSVSSDAAGDFVVVWQSGGQDGSSNGVFGQRFGVATETPTPSATPPPTQTPNAPPTLTPTQTPSGPPPQLLGSEFQVNTYTPGTQAGPSVASDSTGAFVVVWDSHDQDGQYSGVFGQSFDASGAAAGVEFRVNNTTSGSQQTASVGMSGDGRFVAAWEVFGQDGPSVGIFGQLFDPAGNRVGSELQANTFIAGDQKAVSVAIRDSGEFILVWGGLGQGESGGVFAQRYTSTGAMAGTEFQVNTTTTNNQYAPVVAVEGASNGVVAWVSRNQDGSEAGVFARCFDGTGTGLTPEFQVNTYTTSLQRNPAVAMQPGGAFVVAWESIGQELVGLGSIYAQRFDATCLPLGPEFRVSTVVTGPKNDPAVAADGAGRFMIVWWTSLPSPNKSDVFGQAFDSGGAPLGNEFQINTYTPDYQFQPSISASSSGLFTVVWASARQDPLGIASGVFGQRFNMTTKSFTGPTVPDLNCNAAGGDATASFVGGGDDCTFVKTEFIPASGGPTSPPGPAPACFPYGLFDFTTTGCTPGSQLDFTITYPQALPAGSNHYKYGHPDPSNPNLPAQWYQFQGAVLNGNTVTFSITDGGVGDDDLVANGKIVDPDGPGVPSAESLSAALGLWAGLPLLAAAWLLARRLREPVTGCRR